MTHFQFLMPTNSLPSSTQAHLHDLAIATNLMQANSTQLNHVLLTLGYLYKVYMRTSVEAAVRTGVLGSLERRWTKNADHDVFVMAVFLNPYIRTAVFRRGNPLLTPMALYDMARRLYVCLFSRDTDIVFHGAFWDYLNWQCEFSCVSTALDVFKKAYDDQVSALIINSGGF